MDVGDISRRHGMAIHLAWLAAGAMGITKRLVSFIGISAIVDSYRRVAQGRLSQHDLGGFVADVVFHHRCDGIVGQSAAKTGRPGSNTADGFLPGCLQETKPGFKLSSILSFLILCFLYLLRVRRSHLNFLQRLGPGSEILPVKYVDAGHGMHEAAGN